MKKMPLKILSGFCSALLFLFSCDTNEEVTSLKNDQRTPDYYLHEKGFLVFSNDQVFEETATMLQNKDEVDVQAWERRMKFRSMRQIFQEGLKIDEMLAEKKDSDTKKNQYSEFVSNHLETFKILDDGMFTANIYRIDLTPLVNPNGIVKVGGVLFQYSYDYLKVIEDGDDSKISLLDQINETNRELKISVNKVERLKPKETNARTSFYQQSTFTVVEESNQYCEWRARLTAELKLTTVNVPVYELVCRTCYEETGKPYTCCENILVRTDRRNYFEGFCYAEKENGLCAWGGFGSDSRFQLMISGTYIQNGVSKSVYRITPSTASQLRHLIFSSTNTPDANVIDAAITFKDVNNPKGRSVFIGFN
jgi:hypothetical protein